MHADIEKMIDPEQRQRLHKALGIQQWLEQRRVISVADNGIHYECYGDNPENPVIIFLPGIGTYCELYAESLGKIAAQGFNVIGMDYPGHGFSAGKRGVYTIAQINKLISELIDVIQAEYTGDVYIFGYSIGALLAVCAAEKDDRIKAVSCGTLLLPQIPPDAVHWAGWQWTWATSMFMPSYHVPLGQLVDFKALMAGHPAGAEINNDPLIIYDYPVSTLSSLFTARTDIINKPFKFKLSILHGDLDEVIPFHYSMRVQMSCKQPMELIRMPAMGHMAPWLSTEQLVSAVVKSFRAAT